MLCMRKVGHFARYKICPARGKTCAKCGDYGHWAACCRSEAEGKNSGKEGGSVKDGRACGDKQRRSRDAKHDPKSRNKQVNEAEYDNEDVAFSFPISLNEETACEDNVIMVTIDNTTTSMLVESGAQSTVLCKEQFENLVSVWEWLFTGCG